MSDKPKFQFDRVFSRDGKSTEPRPRPRTSFRADEVEAMKAEAFKAGERSALVKAEQAAVHSINALASSIETVLNTMRAELDIVRDDSTRLSAQIARKFVSHMIEKAPELYLERCIDECLEIVHREPEIFISIPAGAAPSLKEHLLRMAGERGLSTLIRVEESTNLKGVACRLSWRSGGAEISLAEALSRMDEIIEDHISSLASTAQPPIEAPAERVSA